MSARLWLRAAGLALLDGIGAALGVDWHDLRTP